MQKTNDISATLLLVRFSKKKKDIINCKLERCASVEEYNTLMHA
jgi:hypothetical protein